MKNLLIVPCYNEEQRLPQEAYLEFAKTNTSLDIQFVNDGSRDGTLAVIQELARKCPNLLATDLPKNVGKAEAIRSTMLSVDTTPYQYIGYADADLATPLSEIKRIYEYAHERDMHFVMGTRFQRLGSQIDRKMSRHYLGRIFATLASTLLRLKVYDTQCGAKAIRSDFVQYLFERPFSSKWFFDVELLFRMKKHSEYRLDKLLEVPLREWKDVAGTKLKLRDFIFAPLELFKIYFKESK